MIIKKVGKIVLGADLTREEQEAINIEIQKQLADYARKHANEMDALILWHLHEQYGFGHKRLKEFHHSFAPAVEALCKRYEMEEVGDEIWLATRKLLDYGISIDEWNKEVEETRN